MVKFMRSKFKIGASVQWKWLGRTISGIILEIYMQPVVKSIKGKKIKRNGTKDNPAFLVKSNAGNEALKLKSELILDETKKWGKQNPTMFGDE